MISLDAALAAWLRRVNTSPVDLTPKVWVAHYNAGLLGEFGLPRVDEDRLGVASYWMLSPFGFSEAVQTSFIIIDHARRLYAARMGLLNSGAAMTYWKIRYSISDDGTTRLADANKTPWRLDRVPEAISTVVQHRLEDHPRHGFDDLFSNAMNELEKM